MSVFHLPDLGEGLHEAEIVAWHVAVGDHVVEGQPLVSVETDKAVVEVPSPQSGHVAALHGEAGERMEVGAALVEFTEGETADTGAIVGDIAGDIVGDIAAPAPLAPKPAPKPIHRPSVKATPAVRALARRLGIDPATVEATGNQGQITAQDLERAAGGDGGARREPLSGPRLAMARNMARAHSEIVPATVNEDAIVDHLDPESDVTVALIRAIAEGVAAVPSLNAWFDGTDLGRTLHERVDVGIAMDTADGLFVPVIRDAGGTTPDELRAALDSLKQDVAARRITPEQLRGQTITLSNFGVLGGRYAELVVMPPQVAIVGAGRIVQRVVVEDGAPAVRRVLPLSLTFDHRAVTGGEAARFLTAIVTALETMEDATG